MADKKTDKKTETTKTLRDLPASDLQAQLTKLRQELWQNRLKARDGSLQQSHLLSQARREIARVHTALRQAASPRKSA